MRQVIVAVVLLSCLLIATQVEAAPSLKEQYERARQIRASRQARDVIAKQKAWEKFNGINSISIVMMRFINCG